jgi:hypothetical protein
LQVNGSARELQWLLKDYLHPDAESLLQAAAAFHIDCYYNKSGNTSSCHHLFREWGIPNIDYRGSFEVRSDILHNLTFSQVCVGMVFNHMLRPANILLIPCNQSYFASFICSQRFKFMTKKEGDKVMGNITHSFHSEVHTDRLSLSPPSHFCPTGWGYLYEKDSCLHFVPINQLQLASFGLELYESVCQQHKLLPFATTYTHLQIFQQLFRDVMLNSIGVVKLLNDESCHGSLCAAYKVTEKRWFSACSQGTACYRNGTLSEVLTCNQCKVYVVCVRVKLPWPDIAQEEAMLHTCHDGALIPDAHICDGFPDCVNGGDESNI